LFDSVKKETQESVDILIDDGIVQRLSATSLPITGIDYVIDAEDRTALPGLINLHTHPQRRHARFLTKTTPFRVGAAAVEGLANTQRLLWAVKNSWYELLREGVTTMRAAGSKDLLNIELRNVFSQGMFNGPRILASGAILATTGGHGTRGIDGAMEVDGPDEVRKAVRMLLKAGADWIKLCVSGGLAGIHKGDHPSIVEFTLEEIKTAVEEAHRRQRKVMVHGMASESVKLAIEAGVNCVEHGNLLDGPTIDLMKENAIAFVPTMSGIYAAYKREKDAGNTQIAEMLWEVISPQSTAVSQCIDTGILIGTGTDTLGSIAEEVSMLVDCGMSNADALSAATLASATILDLDHEIGSIEEGKKADIVLMQGNPLKDISVLEAVKEVILGGHLVNLEFFNREKEE